MRFRPTLQPLESRDTPSGLIPEFDPVPVLPVPPPDPTPNPGGDLEFGGGYLPPPPPIDLG